MNRKIITYNCKALTDIWTGSVNGKPDNLINTGLIGSIRWWFEVLVRGLGGGACDPTVTKCEGRNHCVVCELFGCTGWARKFRFEVLDEDSNIKIDQIKQYQTLSLRFTPLRPIRSEDWVLLDATLRLITEFGSISGKTVFKPTDETERQKEKHHLDYGIVEITRVDPPILSPDASELEKYIREERWRRPASKAKDVDISWASLKHFWFVDKKTLSREGANISSFNKVLGRNESKACRDCGGVHNPPIKCPKTKRHPKRESEHLVNRGNEVSKWLAGSQQKSKKVFSFKKPARTFGFVKPGLIDFDAMRQKLKHAWGPNGWDFLTGDNIIKQLFAGKEDRR